MLFGLASGRKVAFQAHGDRAGCHLRQACGHHHVAVGYGSRYAGGQREGHGEAVGLTDDHVADDVAGCEVLFCVRTRAAGWTS